MKLRALASAWSKSAKPQVSKRVGGELHGNTLVLTDGTDSRADKRLMVCLHDAPQRLQLAAALVGTVPASLLIELIGSPLEAGKLLKVLGDASTKIDEAVAVREVAS